MEKVCSLTAALLLVVLGFSHLVEICASDDNENIRQVCSEKSRIRSCTGFCEKVGPLEGTRCLESFPNGDFIDCKCKDKRNRGETSSDDCDQKIRSDCEDWCQYVKRQITVCEHERPQTNGSIPREVHCFCHTVSSGGKNDLIYQVGIPVVIVLVISLIIAAIFLWRFFQRRGAQNSTESGIQNLLEVLYSRKNRTMDVALPSDYEIDANDLEIDYRTELGQGEFGMVLKAILKKQVPVAAKILKSENDEGAKAMLMEAKIQAGLITSEPTPEKLTATQRMQGMCSPDKTS